ncbi:MAG: universal stress protein [Limimaricola sp.]|uniref:universal stress protein n=1 Tax=Limimaricola sp. TaxID=2211665 RepID=UPI001D463016|nr:universal stress protein [Limimaricola sp.]MBI1418794.1 universal stress protein [Limimaricola sp.]
MGYKTITVVLTDAAADAAALHAARALADQNDAHLDVFCIGIDPTRFEAMPAGSSAVLLETGLEEAKSSAAALAKWARGRLPDQMARLAIEPVAVPQMGLETLVARLARYSDLIVASKPYGKGRPPLLVTVLEAELFGTGAPVLIVPEAPPVGEKPFRRVVVAWNESSESFAAIRSALPVLQKAERVDLIMVDPPAHSNERADPGGAVSMMLARHGVRTEVSVLARTLPRVSETLLRFSREHDADLMVMGGYGHSRFRESMLGGATRDMLQMADLPLLMAH